MNDLMLFPTAVANDPAVDAWFAVDDPLRLMARPWFEAMRASGDDVRELIHDGCPTACLGEAAFGYVNAFRQHVNIGFYQGASLDDPGNLLQGTGKRMRHIKLHWGKPVDEAAVMALISAAYRDMLARAEKAAR